MSIYRQMIEAGVEIASHESDLYVPANEITDAIIREYEFKNQVTPFFDNITRTRWYDIPFAFEPYWITKLDKKVA
jgi:hypothetical protein